MNYIWRKIRIASYYQLEEVIDWAAHLEYLQAVLIEFNITVAPNKDLLIWYFRHSLEFFIWAQLEKQDWNLENSWQEVIKRIIDVDAKIRRQLPFFIRENMLHYFWGY